MFAMSLKRSKEIALSAKKSVQAVSCAIFNFTTMSYNKRRIDYVESGYIRKQIESAKITNTKKESFLDLIL